MSNRTAIFWVDGDRAVLHDDEIDRLFAVLDERELTMDEKWHLPFEIADKP